MENDEDARAFTHRSREYLPEEASEALNALLEFKAETAWCDNCQRSMDNCLNGQAATGEEEPRAVEEGVKLRTTFRLTNWGPPVGQKVIVTDLYKWTKENNTPEYPGTRTPEKPTSTPPIGAYNKGEALYTVAITGWVNTENGDPNPTIRLHYGDSDWLEEEYCPYTFAYDCRPEPDSQLKDSTGTAIKQNRT